MLRLRLGILMFLQYAVPGAFVPLLTPRLKELGFTPVQMGVICATQALAALVATWVVGQVADRWVPAERCLGVCSLLAGVFLWLVAGLTAPVPVFAAYLAVWLMLVPATVLGTSLCFNHLPQPERDFGPVRLWGTIGWVVSGWLLGYWLHQPAWLAEPLWPGNLADIFRLGGLLAFIQAGYAFTLPYTPPARQGAARFAPLDALRLLRQRAFAIYALCTLGVAMTLALWYQVTPLLLESVGISKQWLGPTLTLSQSIEVLALALLPLLLLRLGMRGTMRLGLAAWLAALAILTWGEPTWLVVSSLALNGLCICCYVIAGQVFINSRARGDFRASAQGLFTFLTGVGLLTGNLFFGWVRQEVNEAFRPTFGVAVALTGVLFLVFLFGFPADEAIAPVAAVDGTGVERASAAGRAGG